MKGKTNFRELPVKELDKMHNDMKKKQRESRVEKVTGSNFNPSEYKKERRDIARIKTILRENELGIRPLKGDK
ncbi:MAG TPA: 50S ribosomal protein L29 [Spirochaetia bacterium]|nr:MAG: 50S ribosomal protein L29 [Spirochaetes bacterium GWB1_36_13]HCL57332.1 50S ribosomal protein L29 [Spirochaetia bacterium]